MKQAVVFVAVIVALLGATPADSKAQRPVFVEGWSSETHPAARFASDSAACVAVGAEIATLTQKDASPEFARCLRNREWIPVRRVVPAPNCVPVALRLIGAATLPDSGKRGAALLEHLGAAASQTIPELEVSHWKDQTIVGSIHRYGWIDLNREGTPYETLAFLRELIDASNIARLGGEWEQLAGTPIVVSFRPRCFPVYRTPAGWREPPTPRRVPVDVTSNQTHFSFQVDKEVVPLMETLQVEYPEALNATKVSGMVEAQFVVDTGGRIELGSFKVLRSTNEVFTAAVRAHLPHMRFLPAQVKGAPVRQLVQQRFEFNAAR